MCEISQLKRQNKLAGNNCVFVDILFTIVFLSISYLPVEIYFPVIWIFYMGTDPKARPPATYDVISLNHRNWPSPNLSQNAREG